MSDKYKLNEIKKGFFLNYEGDVFEVASECIYRFERKIILEWGLVGFTKSMYLQYIEGADEEWVMASTISLRDIEPDLKNYILENGHPYDELTYGDYTYILEDLGQGNVYFDAKTKNRQNITLWVFTNNFNNNYLIIHKIDKDDIGVRLAVAFAEKDVTNIKPFSI